ncbi:MAG: CRISPR-associated endonuclease Cas2 [Patescibacteria group bacterium]|nr:CRISPR-associated endonuclease Cas2 [Patescibacteria group bacterium]
MITFKERLTDLVLEIIYESRRVLTTHSLMEAVYFDLTEKIKNDQKRIKFARKEKEKIQKTIYHLRRMGCIEMNNNKIIKLSVKGRIKMILYKSRKIRKKDTKSYFYILIFDIPENMRKIRDLFRRVLYNFGSDKLQKSVFTIESEEAFILIKDLIKESKMNDYVKILKCSKIEKI